MMKKRGFAVGDSGLILYTSNSGTTSVENKDNPPPKQFTLEQNFPNPLNPGTTIKYNLLGIENIRLIVYNLLGQIVSILVDEKKSSGSYSALFYGSGCASEVYFYRLQSGTFNEKKFI